MGTRAVRTNDPGKEFHRELYATVFKYFLQVSGKRLESVAKIADCDLSYLYYIRDGSRLPSIDKTLVLDRSLGAGGLLVQVRKLIDRGQVNLRKQARTVGNEDPAEEDDRERRLLQSLAALGIATSSVTGALETIRLSVDQTLGPGDGRHLDDWEETVREYGYAFVTTPSQQLVTDLAADLVTVRSIVGTVKHDHPHHRDWSHISGGLAALMAMVVGNQGRLREARDWWCTAQRAADASGDLDLRLWVRGRRIVHGLYERRPLAVLLRQADEAESLAAGHTCAGLASVHSGRAQALALIEGRDREALVQTRRAQEVFEELPAAVTRDVASSHGWAETRLLFTQTWVHAYLGHEADADTVAEQALKLYPAGHRAPLQIKMLQALARVDRGDVTEGIRHAHTVYAGAPPEHRTHMVSDVAHRVLYCVPPEQRNHSDVAAYRELLSQPPSV